jgi:K+-sensing histidine kinase KdpD
MENVKQRGGSVLFIDHKVQDIYAYADSFLVLYGGRNLIKIEKNEVTTRELEKMLISSHLSTVKEMAAGITHQIRNPLAIMKVTAQMAKEDFKVQSRQKEFEENIEAVIRNIDIIDLYVHSFFNFTHEQDSYYKKCKVRNVITEAVNKIPGHVVGERVILRDILDQEMEYPMIRSNVVQVLINLLINVIEFSEPEGTIRIEAYVRNHLHIQFTYRGKIMPHGFESGLYAPLFLHEQNTAGLGVTLFHHMFQQHKCTIEVGSKDGSAKYLELIL